MQPISIKNNIFIPPNKKLRGQGNLHRLHRRKRHQKLIGEPKQENAERMMNATGNG